MVGVIFMWPQDTWLRNLFPTYQTVSWMKLLIGWNKLGRSTVVKKTDLQQCPSCFPLLHPYLPNFVKTSLYELDFRLHWLDQAALRKRCPVGKK